MGTTLITEDVSVDERFREIVGDCGVAAVTAGNVRAKIQPIEDPNSRPEPEREDSRPERESEDADRDQRESEGHRGRSDDR